MNRGNLLLLGLLMMGCVFMVNAGDKGEANNGEAYIVSPNNGDVVSGPVKVIFGLKGYGVAPAGVNKSRTGHHHLLVNSHLQDMGKAIPKTDNHRHFGGGQTETTLNLAPGKHTLQLVLGDHKHVPHNPPIKSETISITVK